MILPNFGSPDKIIVYNLANCDKLYHLKINLTHCLSQSPVPASQASHGSPADHSWIPRLGRLRLARARLTADQHSPWGPWEGIHEQRDGCLGRVRG